MDRKEQLSLISKCSVLKQNAAKIQSQFLKQSDSEVTAKSEDMKNTKLQNYAGPYLPVTKWKIFWPVRKIKI